MSFPWLSSSFAHEMFSMRSENGSWLSLIIRHFTVQTLLCSMAFVNWLIKHCIASNIHSMTDSLMCWIHCVVSWTISFVFPIYLHRNKAILFYFNILQCANPAVLINLQCPTTQVRDLLRPHLAADIRLFYVPVHLFLHGWLCKINWLIQRMCCCPQLCVSKCPDRFATYLDMQYNYRYNKSYWEYYKQFCKPGFDNPYKVRNTKAITNVLLSDWVL